ncbi:hypothetical protein GSI_10194 [Ganoderma sinense ZZ0214-1]|uniref:Uncharacterized protein n=1 Tax=Ganoderma sinense ZZ0214-1 TaxID=1077348 RepID=A0A2G8RZY1_9APHY|nr:hypothetical protein GSI_10194 [Ganoderma sinense ZZ0214-1]
MPPSNDLPQLSPNVEGEDSQSTQQADDSQAGTSSALHIGDQPGPVSPHSTRATKPSSSLKVRTFDLPDIRPESVLATMLLSSGVPDDTATKNIAPLKRDVSLLALAIDSIRTDSHDYMAKTTTDLLHLTTVAESILARLKSPHLFSGDGAAALHSVDDRLSRLAADVEQNSANVDIEFNGVQQRSDGMADSIEHLRNLYDDIDQTLQRVLRAHPPPLDRPASALPDRAPPPFPQAPPPLPPPPPSYLGAPFPLPSPQMGPPLSMGPHQGPVPQPIAGPSQPFHPPVVPMGGFGPQQPKRAAPTGAGNPVIKRPRHEPPPLPAPVPPGVDVDDEEAEEPHVFVRLGSVKWDRRLSNPLEGQVLFAITPIFDADPTLRPAYRGATFIPGEKTWVALKFTSAEKASTFVSLWFQYRDNTTIKKAQAKLPE